MCAGRSPAGRALRSSGRSAAPRAANSSCLRATSAVSRESSRARRSGWVRWTTAPVCGSASRASRAPLPQSMPYRCRSAQECARARAPAMERRVCDRPARGEPTRCRWPKADRSRDRGVGPARRAGRPVRTGRAGGRTARRRGPADRPGPGSRAGRAARGCAAAGRRAPGWRRALPRPGRRGRSRPSPTRCARRAGAAAGARRAGPSRPVRPRARVPRRRPPHPACARRRVRPGRERGRSARGAHGRGPDDSSKSLRTQGS